MNARIVLAGASGYGRTYLRELADLEQAGQVRLVGVCDVAPLDAEAATIVAGRPVDHDLTALLAATRPDIVVVATPIQLHETMASEALAAGAQLVLEKPPTATLAGWQRLVDCPGPAARQVGFQSLGSAALTRLRTLLKAGTLGAVRGIGVWGAWSRPVGYYRRAAWAGRRMLDAIPVSDGVLTNPFAHGVATALALDNSTAVADIADVQTELWRANEIEADDTSCVRIRTARGTEIVVAATLCAEAEHEPVVIVHGSRGRADLHYTQDVLVVAGRTEHFERVSPLRDLLAHRADPSHPLQSPLSECGAFMAVVEAIRLADEPRLIPEHARRESGAGEDRRVHVVGVNGLVEQAAERMRLFSELDCAPDPVAVTAAAP